MTALALAPLTTALRARNDLAPPMKTHHAPKAPYRSRNGVVSPAGRP